MKHIRPLALVALLALGGAAVVHVAPVAVAQDAPRPTAFEVDAVHSSVVFAATHMGVGKQYGWVNQLKGTFAIKADGALDVDLTLDMASLDTNNKQRDEHLRAADWFNVKQYPTATFKSTAGKALPNGDAEVTGDLTFMGKALPVRVTMKKLGERDIGGRMGYRAGYETTFTIDRVAYGMDEMAGAIGNEVTLMVALEGVRR